MATTRFLRSTCPCGSWAICDTLAEVNSIAEAFLQAATHAPQPIQAAASMALSCLSRGTGIAFPSGACPALTET